MNETDRFAVLVESLRASLGPHADNLRSVGDQVRAFMATHPTDSDLGDMRHHYSMLFDVLRARASVDNTKVSDGDLRFVLQLADALRSDIEAEAARSAPR